MRRPRPSNSERGVALPFAIVVTMILTLLVTDIEIRTKISFDRARRAVRMEEARSLMRAIEAAIRSLTAEQIEEMSKDPQEFELDGYRVRLTFAAAEGRININRLNDLILGEAIQKTFRALLRRERFEYRAFPCAMDWVDADDDPQINGAERPDYAGEDVSPRNAAFETVDELAFVRGFADASAFSRIQPFLTTDGTGRIYLPAADERLIDVIADAFGPSVKTGLLDAQRNPGRPVQIPERMLSAKDARALEQLFTAQAQTWEIRMTLTADRFSTRADYILQTNEDAASRLRMRRVG